MAGFAFGYEDGGLEPIVQVGENVRLIPTLAAKFFKVDQIEPIQPRIVDFCGATFINGVLPANGVSGYTTKGFEMRDAMAVWAGQLARYRVIPLDDIMLVISHVGASNQLYTIRYTETYISKDKPRHARSFYQAGAAAADVLVWTTTNTNEAGRRKAQIKKIALTEEAGVAGVLRFGDAAAAGGALANAANAVFSFSFNALETIVLHEKECPDYRFLSGLVYQLTAGTVRVNVTVEEDNVGPLPNYSDVFVWEDKVPWIKVINPESTAAQTTARVIFPGERYVLEEIPKPAKWTDIPISKAITGE